MTYEITLIKSLIGRTPRQKATAKALGLGRVGSTVTKENNSAIRGQIEAIAHLCKVVEK